MLLVCDNVNAMGRYSRGKVIRLSGCIFPGKTKRAYER